MTWGEGGGGGGGGFLVQAKYVVLFFFTFINDAQGLTLTSSVY